MSTAYISPDADVTDGGWTTESGGTTLFASIDEHLTPSDADYIKSSTNPSADICKISLANPATGTISGPFNVSYRYGKGGSATIDLKVRLKQGTTTIHEWTHTGVSATPATVTQTLSAPELASISDFNDLFLEFEANVPAAAYVGPGDVVASATAWWGLRAYTSASIGANAIRLRRSSDNAELDWPTIAGGGLDVASIATWRDAAGAATLFVRTLYDQIGTLHAGQTTAGSQPQLLLSDLSSKPTMQFGSGLTLVTPNLSSAFNQPFTFTTINIYTGAAGYNAWQGQNANQLNGHTASANQHRIYAGGVGLSFTASDNNWHALQLIFNDTACNGAVDGTSNVGSGGNLGMLSGSPIILGGDTYSTYWLGKIAEIGLWSTAFSGTNITDMNANQHTYWGF